MTETFYYIEGGFAAQQMYVYSNSRFKGYDLLSGDLKLPLPLQFERGGGKIAYDFMIGGSPSIMLFHNRLFEELKRGNVTGYDSIPAIIKSESETVNNYSCLVVTGRASNIDYTKGEVINRGPIVQGGTDNIVKKGIFFDESTWDGSDIFLLSGTLYLLITDKVERIMESLGMTNIRPTPVSEYECNIEQLAAGNPDLLKFYLSQLKT